MVADGKIRAVVFLQPLGEGVQERLSAVDPAGNAGIPAVFQTDADSCIRGGFSDSRVDNLECIRIKIRIFLQRSGAGIKPFVVGIHFIPHQIITDITHVVSAVEMFCNTGEQSSVQFTGLRGADIPGVIIMCSLGPGRGMNQIRETVHPGKQKFHRQIHACILQLGKQAAPVAECIHIKCVGIAVVNIFQQVIGGCHKFCNINVKQTVINPQAEGIINTFAKLQSFFGIGGGESLGFGRCKLCAWPMFFILAGAQGRCRYSG